MALQPAGCAHGDRNVLFSQTVARREVSQITRNFASILRHRLAYQFSKGHKNDADLRNCSRSRVLIVASKNRITLPEQRSTKAATDGFCGDSGNGLHTRTQSTEPEQNRHPCLWITGTLISPSF